MTSLVLEESTALSPATHVYSLLQLFVNVCGFGRHLVVQNFWYLKKSQFFMLLKISY